MDGLVFKQFELARSWSIDLSESLSKESVNVKPKGFNNTLQWQVGHILTTTEYFLFELPYNENNLPAGYAESFGSGTHPDNWEEDVPAVEQLVAQLKEQFVRIREISTADLSEYLPKPMHGFKTLADCAGFSVLHEVLHIGKIEEMERVIIHSRAEF